jgi:cytochrome c-type biogenesis protein CcmH/NrfG
MTVAGQAFLQLDQREDARQALERALELQPVQPLAAKLLAANSISSGDTNRGLKYLAKAAQFDPDDSRPWTVMGKVFFSRKEYSRSVDAYEQALRRNRKDREALAGIIAVLLDQSRDEEAGYWVGAALQNEPDDAKVLGLAALQSYATCKPQVAAEFAERALVRAPEEFNALLVRAKVAMLEGRLESAHDDAEQAVAVDPNDVSALHLLAQLEFRLGLTERAQATVARRDRVQSRRVSITKLAEIIASRPREPELHCLMGQLALEAGLTALATESYRAALNVRPQFGPALKGLAAVKAVHSRERD